MLVEQQEQQQLHANKDKIMLPSYRLTHSERLRNRGSIRRLFEEGKSGFVYPIRFMWYAQEVTNINSEEQNLCDIKVESSISSEVLFSVPKRFHKRANKRNILRRRIKEVYRLNKSIIIDKECGRSLEIDIAMIYSTKEVHSYKTISHAVRKILEQIAQGL